MTLLQTRQRLDELWRASWSRGQSLMDPYYAVERLEGAYRSAPPEMRQEMDRVFCDWLSSDDENLRMVAAGFLLDHRTEVGAVALKALGQRLAESDDPLARFERERALDFATQIDAAEGFERMVADPASTAAAARDALARLDAERAIEVDLRSTKAPTDQLEHAMRMIEKWQADDDKAGLAGVAQMVADDWALDCSLSQLLLAVCDGAGAAGSRRDEHGED